MRSFISPSPSRICFPDEVDNSSSFLSSFWNAFNGLNLQLFGDCSYGTDFGARLVLVACPYSFRPLLLI